MLRTPSWQVDSTWLVFLLSCCTHRLGSLRNFWAVSPLMPRRQKRTILLSVSERHSEPKICDDSIFRLSLPVEDLLMWNKRPGGLVVSNSAFPLKFLCIICKWYVQCCLKITLYLLKLAVKRLFATCGCLINHVYLSIADFIIMEAETHGNRKSKTGTKQKTNSKLSFCIFFPISYQGT